MRTTFFLTLAVLLGGCTVGPDYAAPELNMPNSFVQSEQAEPQVPPELIEWWTVFNDPVLNDLMKQAGSGNLDLRIAEARVREARAFRGVVAADDQPQVNTFGNANRSRTSENVNGGPGGGPGETTNLFEVGFDANWEIDLFGRVRRGVEAANADIQASEADRAAVMVTVFAETARAYIELRQFQRRLEIAQENIGTQAETRDLSRALFEAGLRSEFDVARSEAQLALTQAVLPVFQVGMQQAIHRLSVLVGRPPAALREQLLTAAPIPEGPVQVPVGLPADLLRRRPDLLAAERALAAATARIGVATADLYPRVTILGSLGLSADDISNVFEWGSRNWSLGPQIVWPLFEGGRIRANIGVQDARTEQMLHQYEQAVLVSLREVEDALVAHAQEQIRYRTLLSAVDADRRAVDLSTELYKGGLGDFLNVLDSERSLFASEDEMIVSQGQVALNLIAVYKAIGGGWDPEEFSFNQSPPPQQSSSRPPASTEPDASAQM